MTVWPCWWMGASISRLGVRSFSVLNPLGVAFLQDSKPPLRSLLTGGPCPLKAWHTTRKRWACQRLCRRP